MPDPIKVLLAGDHPVVSVGLASQLKTANDVRILGEAGSPQEVLEKAVALNPDFIILDVTTTELDWPHNIISIKACLKRVRLLVYTISQTKDELIEAERAGAWASLPFDFTPIQILDMLRAGMAY
jgi:two-component system, NarL family, nitrate/nitrite response regulator NarL